MSFFHFIVHLEDATHDDFILLSSVLLILSENVEKSFVFSFEIFNFAL